MISKYIYIFIKIPIYIYIYIYIYICFVANMLGTNLDGNTQFEVVTVTDRDNVLGTPAGKRIVMEYNLVSHLVGQSTD